MLISTLYVPTDCPQGRQMATYILWPKNLFIMISLKKPEEWIIDEIFNPAQSMEIKDKLIVFSGFINNGYLGVVFRIPVLDVISKTEEIIFQIDDKSDFYEVYEKKVTIFKPLEITSDSLYNSLTCSAPPEEKHALLTVPNEDVLITRLRGTTGYQQIPDGNIVIAGKIRKIFMKADTIDTDLSDEFRIDGKYITLHYTEKLIKYVLILVPKIPRPLPKTVKYVHAVPFRVIIQHVPDLTPIPEAVVYTNDGYKIKLGHLVIGERYLFSLEYAYKDLAFLDRLVENYLYIKSVDPNSITYTYDISALLKYPELLHRDECEVDIQGIEIGLDFLVSRETIDRIQDVISTPEYDSRNFFIQNFETTPDFTNPNNCIQLNNPQGISSPTSIRIKIHTDLSSYKPASNGILTYKRQE